MIVVKQLAAEFQIELVIELRNAVADVRGLHREVFFVVKTDPCHTSPVKKITFSSVAFFAPILNFFCAFFAGEAFLPPPRGQDLPRVRG